MTNGWQTKHLGELCRIRTGKKDVNQGNPDGEFPFFTCAAKHTFSDTFSFDTEALLIAGNGDVGNVSYYKGKFEAYQRTYVLSDFKQVLPRFLYLILDGKLKETVSQQKLGNTMPYIKVGMLTDFCLPVPPLPEQQRIVGILDESFAGIATAKANAEKNLQNARALFESHLHSVFTQHGDEWKMEKLDNLTRLARGHNPPKSKFSLEQKPGYVRFYQIRDGATDDYTVYVPDTPQLHKMKKDDIMMVAYRHIGRTFRGVEGAFNVALCKISNARRDLLDDDFLFHLIPSQYVKGELLKRAERSLIPSMSIEHLREIKIPLPPIGEQKRLVKTIRSLTEETQRLEALYQQKLAALEALKKSLLHQAFTGQLTMDKC